MSAPEIVQQAYAAFGEGDMETLASLMSDCYVGELPESLPNMEFIKFQAFDDSAILNSVANS